MFPFIGLNILFAISKALGPLSLTIPIPASPGAVATAAIVSSININSPSFSQTRTLYIKSTGQKSCCIHNNIKPLVLDRGMSTSVLLL